jgi:hypothetical protein
MSREWLWRIGVMAVGMLPVALIAFALFRGIQ